jgi:hypothetical protein
MVTLCNTAGAVALTSNDKKASRAPPCGGIVRSGGAGSGVMVKIPAACPEDAQQHQNKTSVSMTNRPFAVFFICIPSSVFVFFVFTTNYLS